MQTNTILLILLALLLSLSIVYFQYLYKSQDSRNRKAFFFVVRFFSLFSLFLLLINPTIEQTLIEYNKPVLGVLIDNSSSIKFLNQTDTVRSVVHKIESNKALRTKFDIQYVAFGEDVRVQDSLRFNEHQTDISKGLQAIQNLYQSPNGAVVLLSDGNQTSGIDYEFTNPKKPVFPIIIGDTTRYQDLSIRQINVNAYSYVQNKFPVEVMLIYKGNTPVTRRFTIYQQGKSVYTQNVRFTPSKKSVMINTHLTARKEGFHFYTASVQHIENEKNVQNNSKKFSVEVISELTKIVIVSSISHPDLGLLKKSLETNKQRSVEIVLIDELKNKINDCQFVVLYQPNNKFKDLLTSIKTQNLNYLLISGAATDWNFINQQQLGFSKQAIHQTENYSADFNASFLPFLQKDIGFKNFPPLKDQFGEVLISREHQQLLSQNVLGISSQQPLIATLEQNNQKTAVIFGEGIWKWRATSYLLNNSFHDFDEFIGSLAQYLASNKKRNRLDVRAAAVYPANLPIHLSAYYTDENYQFDKRASLLCTLVNEENKAIKKIPFSLVNDTFQLVLEDLPSGNYTYNVGVEGQQIQKRGSFSVIASRIEEQFHNANSDKLTRFANATGGRAYLSSEIDRLINELNSDATLVTTQKSTLKEQHLIDFKWLLALILLLLTIEWFVRKYYGKI